MARTKTKRADKELAEARVNEMLRAILDGAQKWDFVDYVRDHEKKPASPWFVTEGGKPLKYSQIRRYVAKAKELIAKTGQCERDELLERAIAQREHLYTKAIATKKWQAALAILDSRDKLRGLFPKEEAKPAPNNDGRMILNVVETMIVNNPPAPALAGPANPLQLTEEVTCHVPGTNGIPVATEVREASSGAA